ncbi:Phox (PX) domain-containing protein, partial [Striga asiatica]
MEELRQRSIELELKLNSEQLQLISVLATHKYYYKLLSRPRGSILSLPIHIITRKICCPMRWIPLYRKHEDLLKRHQELELKSKADIKVLVKEVKNLRSSHAELTEQLNQSVAEKSKAEEQLREERVKNEQTRTSWREFLDKFRTLHEQLQECHINYLNLTEGDDMLKTISSFSEPIDIVATSDNQIGLLISKVQLLAQECDDSASTNDTVDELHNGTSSLDEELRKMLMSVLVDNGVLRKQVNSLIVSAEQMTQ